MNDPTVRGVRWSERVVAAYVLLVLTRKGLLTKAEAREAAGLLGVTIDDAMAAGERVTDPPRLSSTWAQPATSPSGPVPKGKPRKPGRGYMNRRQGRKGPERRCTRCEKWFPADEEHFGFKEKNPPRLRSWCRPCWNDYQRERYLSRAQEELLEAAGVTFVLDQDQPALACAKCGGPLRAGDEVEGHTTLSHLSCGRPQLDAHLPMPHIPVEHHEIHWDPPEGAA